MRQTQLILSALLMLLVLLAVQACTPKHPAEKPVLVLTPEEMDAEVSRNIRAVLRYAGDNEGYIGDSLQISSVDRIHQLYSKKDFKGIWSSREKFTDLTDSMIIFLYKARVYGLFPEDYHYHNITSLYDQLIIDSLSKTNAILWTRADLLLTDALFKILSDVKVGRLMSDSVALKKNLKQDSLYSAIVESIFNTGKLNAFVQLLEPRHFKYQAIRAHVRDFIRRMDTTRYIHLEYPYEDSMQFIASVYRRLLQSGYGVKGVVAPDSAQFSTALSKYQDQVGLVVDGIAGPAVVGSLNNNDRAHFRKIAITLDRYKSIAPPPNTFIWVNIPSFHLELWDMDSLVLISKVIVGKPATKTPELHSSIYNMVTYPNWTIPASIIRKDILPQLKKDPGYLARKGFNLFTYKGQFVDPYTVDWSKYKRNIPWKIVQGSGDDNALGIFKFNFYNPYDVYLHDTNQRYLFAHTNRALSHGCVRVQKWLELANFIARNDSSITDGTSQVAYSTDSLKLWIANQSRKSIMIKDRIPIFIRYFTCDVVHGQLQFYNDIYGKDKDLWQKYFKGRLN